MESERRRRGAGPPYEMKSTSTASREILRGMPRLPSRPVALLSELVACPSVQPNGECAGTPPGEAAMAKLVASHLRSLGADVEFYLLAPGRPTVIGVFEPAGRVRETVMFAPHLDTVGVAGMTVPPF